MHAMLWAFCELLTVINDVPYRCSLQLSAAGMISFSTGFEPATSDVML